MDRHLNVAAIRSRTKKDSNLSEMQQAITLFRPAVASQVHTPKNGQSRTRNHQKFNVPPPPIESPKIQDSIATSGGSVDFVVRDRVRPEDTKQVASKIETWYQESMCPPGNNSLCSPRDSSHWQSKTKNVELKLNRTQDSESLPNSWTTTNSNEGGGLQHKYGLGRSEYLYAPKPPGVIRFYTDQGFRPLLCAFRNMAWKDFANRGRWHIFWANVANARALFQPGQRYYFNDDQLVNHYFTCYHLSRKDNMTKNIKKYRMEMHQAKNSIAAKDKYGNFLYLDLIAPTYLLPFDYKNFVAEFKRHGGLWIIKPCSGSQGQGICLLNHLEQARKWQDRAIAEVAASVHDNESYQGFLISRYLADPLLIDGKKFDLRLYVLVTSFKPLRCYYYRQGFCRFCATKYTSDSASIDDKFVHLTNVAVQKHKKGYNKFHGNKWNLKAFRLFMERAYGRKKTDSLFDKIFWLIVQSLKSVQLLMDNDRHSFELYGYDCLIDAHLKPWLLEINASPSLEDSTPIDRVNKTSLLMDTMRMALYERCPHLLDIHLKNRDIPDMPLGDYEVLFIEEPLQKVTPVIKVKKAMGRYGSVYGPQVPTHSGVEEKPRWRGF